MPADFAAIGLTPHPKPKGGSYHMTDGRNCVAAGNGLAGGIAGVSAVVSVRCRDARNEPRTKGGDVVLVYIIPEGHAPTDAHVIDNTDGTYTCTYLPSVASPNCKVTVTVNGTHVIGSPFPASVQPGRTEAQQSEVFGHGLNDGVAGQKNYFTIQTKDPFGNRCVHNEANKDKFCIVIKPVHSLLPELDVFLRKYEASPIITDNEDGTHSVEYTVDYAGFYAVEVTFANVPVGDSPYTACICNPTIAFPPAVEFAPLPGDASSVPTDFAACDMVQIHDMIAMLRSKPIELTNNRREREYVHFYRLTSAMARGKELWDSLTLRGPMNPPPRRRECLEIEQRMIVVAHTDDKEDDYGGASERTPLNHCRILDLSDLKAANSWEEVALEGKIPNAIEGYSVCMWAERASILVAGGFDASGKVVNDIFMLQLGHARGAPMGNYRVIQEWPSSILSGHQYPARANFSLTNRQGTPLFFIFGGRGEGDELLNDLYAFDMEEEQWSQPQTLNDKPEAREHHAACFVADRYLFVHGGMDSEGNLLETAAVYDVVTALWSIVEGVAPRACHRIVDRGGVMYILGGIDADGAPAPTVPLVSQVFPYAQKSSFDFLGNNSQALVVKPGPKLAELRNIFSVEAVFYARSFSGNPYNPIIVKCDNGLKTGFGMLGQEHPAYKGDAEEGPWVHFFVGQWTTGGHQMVGARIELETWTHAVATYNGSEIRLYINGSLKSQIEWPVTEEEAETLHTKGDLFIGGMPGKYAFDGFVDECRVWDTCRTEEEAKKYMNAPVVDPRERACIGQWTFNEGAGEQVVDSSPAKNHAAYDRYAGGVELRRVQSRRPFLQPFKTEREKHIDMNFEKLQKWKDEFEARNGRQPTKAEIMMDPEMGAVARRLGEFGTE